MKFTMKNGTFNVNGKTFSGNNVSIVNGKVIIDGKEQADFPDQPIKVDIHGDVDKIETESGDVNCHGVAGRIATQSGDIECDNIQGNVSTMSGDVTAECIEGNVSTISGDISER